MSNGLLFGLIDQQQDEDDDVVLTKDGKVIPQFTIPLPEGMNTNPDEMASDLTILNRLTEPQVMTALHNTPVIVQTAVVESIRQLTNKYQPLGNSLTTHGLESFKEKSDSRKDFKTGVREMNRLHNQLELQVSQENFTDVIKSVTQKQNLVRTLRNDFGGIPSLIAKNNLNVNEYSVDSKVLPMLGIELPFEQQTESTMEQAIVNGYKNATLVIGNALRYMTKYLERESERGKERSDEIVKVFEDRKNLNLPVLNNFIEVRLEGINDVLRAFPVAVPRNDFSIYRDKLNFDNSFNTKRVTENKETTFQAVKMLVTEDDRKGFTLPFNYNGLVGMLEPEKLKGKHHFVGASMATEFSPVRCKTIKNPNVILKARDVYLNALKSVSQVLDMLNVYVNDQGRPYWNNDLDWLVESVIMSDPDAEELMGYLQDVLNYDQTSLELFHRAGVVILIGLPTVMNTYDNEVLRYLNSNIEAFS